MKLYKLTDENGQTYEGCQWGENVTHGEDELLEGEGPLCSGYWYHAYQDPVLAVIMNPVHANFQGPRLWEAEGEVGWEEPDKVGCKDLTTLREIPLPEVAIIQKQAFAILAALEVYDDSSFVNWAGNWFSGKDRSASAAASAASAANAAASAAASAAAWDAANAAASAASAANAAASAAAWDAANAAANAVARGEIDLVAMVRKVIEEF